jgi:hypothetical protein
MLENLNGEQMHGIPKRRRAFFNSIRRRMTDVDYQAAVDAVNRYFDAHEKFVVSSFIPGSDWTGTPFQPIYIAANQSWDNARFFFGLVVWDAVANHRPNELWRFLPAGEDDDILGTNYWPV